MKTKLNNSVRKLKHSKKTSKRFNNKIKSAKKLVKMVPKRNLKKSKKQKKTKSVKKMVGGANVSVDCEDVDNGGDKYKQCKIRTFVAPSGAVKTPDEIKKDKKIFLENTDLIALKDNTSFTLDELNFILEQFFQYQLIYINNVGIKNNYDFKITDDDNNKYFNFANKLQDIANIFRRLGLMAGLVHFIAEKNINEKIFADFGNLMDLMTLLIKHIGEHENKTDIYIDIKITTIDDNILILVISTVLILGNELYKNAENDEKNLIRQNLNYLDLK